MKKLSVALLVCSALLLSACSNSKKAESTDTISKQETKTSSTDELKKKEAAKANKRAEEAEKKKQEEISKKVLEADTAMKNAEANPTNETLATAKTAIEAIPGGNADLQKRLETAAANLEAIKQQATQAQQQQATTQEQSNQVQNDADGNGIPDDSPYNNTTPEERARGAQMEAEANAQWHQGQENIQNGYDPNGQPLLPGQDHAAGANPDGSPDAWVQDQIDWAIENGYSNPDGTPTEKGQQAIDEVNANAIPTDDQY
ncbi:hypothetical protein P7D52_09475 [Enterococcus dongliensis]|uniref:Lipoprotein n=1 Tax=Enterococcus dongliensis TaxID=2559925 RepID=A0AAW8TDT6_9ENTE|nr:hypothetical protein [Enterococcus dongliensis]MDT2634984.1 hypothetical protein [Enterococcus dongliensis]MDT2636208.1 hypothetical protein [Enterococcus dongliensis]MDT2643019.1 hypothetical protein [Enterococcus dongliensis]